MQLDKSNPLLCFLFCAHGDQVSGIAAGVYNGSNSATIMGVAPSADLIIGDYNLKGTEPIIQIGGLIFLIAQEQMVQ